MDELEKQRLRDLKTDAANKLIATNISDFRLSVIDVRLENYLQSVKDNADAHNLYEVLAANRFFRLFQIYEFRADEFRKFVRCYENLIFPTAEGNRRYKLTPVQIFQFASILGFYKANGKRLCREALLFVPRKFSKTTSVAALAIYDLLFGDYNAQAYVAANSYEQAQVCFKIIKGTLKNMDSKLRYFRINREIIYNLQKKEQAFARCLASNPDNLDGLNASTVILDEYAKAKTSELKNVLTSSMGARKNPLTIVITTASDNLDSPFYRLLTGYKKILLGEIEDDSVFAHIFEPDVDDEESDPATWKKVQPHFGITIEPDFYELEYKKALRTSDDMLTFRNKLLNIFAVNDSKAWISSELAKSMFTDANIDNMKDAPAMAAFDLSIHDDFSAITYTVYNNQSRSFFAHTDYYFPEAALSGHQNEELYRGWAAAGYLRLCKGDYIDYNMIVEDILRRNKNIRILNIGYDAYKSQECVNMLAAAGAGNNVLKPVPQTYGNFTSPVESFEYAARAGKVKLNNNPINAYCFGNAIIDTDRNENKKPIKKIAWQKIDGVITTLMTFWLFNNFEQ